MVNKGNSDSKILSTSFEKASTYVWVSSQSFKQNSKSQGWNFTNFVQKGLFYNIKIKTCNW